MEAALCADTVKQPKAMRSAVAAAGGWEARSSSSAGTATVRASTEAATPCQFMCREDGRRGLCMNQYDRNKTGEDRGSMANDRVVEPCTGLIRSVPVKIGGGA